MKISIKDFFSKCDQIRRKLRIWSHLLKKSLMGNLIFCAVYDSCFRWIQYKTKHCVIMIILLYYLQCKSPHSIQMRESTDQKDSKYGHISRCESHDAKAISQVLTALKLNDEILIFLLTKFSTNKFIFCKPYLLFCNQT